MKLPRFTATTPPPRDTGLVRAQDIGALTDVGSAEFRAIEGVGRAVQDVSQIAFQAYMDRQALDDQQKMGEISIKAQESERLGVEEIGLIDMQGARPLPNEPDYYKGDKIPDSATWAKSNEKVFADHKNRITSLAAAIKDPGTRQEWINSQLVRGADSFGSISRAKYNEYQEVTILGYAKDAASNGDIETANKWVDIAEKHGLIGPKKAAIERDRNEVAAAKSAKNAILQAAMAQRENGVLDIPAANGVINNSKFLTSFEKTELLSRLNTLWKQEKNQLDQQFANRTGDEAERLGGLLAEEVLTEDEIDEINLGGIGEQKIREEEFKEKWRGLLRAKVTRKEPLVSDEDTYDQLTVGSGLVQSGGKTPGEWETEFAEADAAGLLNPADRRTLRSKDVVATQSMQNSTFTQTTVDNRSSLVESTEGELEAIITARKIAVESKDVPAIDALSKALQKAQVQKWNFGRYRTELRQQVAQNPEWSQKQIFVASAILIEKYDKPFSELSKEFDNDNAEAAILVTPPDDAFKDIWSGLSQDDRARVWELRMNSASVQEILGEVPE